MIHGAFFSTRTKNPIEALALRRCCSAHTLPQPSN